MKIKKKMTLRSIAGEYVLVPVGESAGEYKGMFMLTETGAYMYSVIEKVDSAFELARMTSEEFDGDFDEILTDANNFIKRLKEYDII